MAQRPFSVQFSSVCSVQTTFVIRATGVSRIFVLCLSTSMFAYCTALVSRALELPDFHFSFTVANPSFTLVKIFDFTVDTYDEPNIQAGLPVLGAILLQ